MLPVQLVLLSVGFTVAVGSGLQYFSYSSWRSSHCRPVKCDEPCKKLKGRDNCPFCSCMVACGIPKCQSGCTLRRPDDDKSDSTFDRLMKCPVCVCKDDDKKIPELPPASIACDIPKCPPSCRIQEVYEGPCPGCDCEKDDELSPDKVECHPPKCAAGCSVEEAYEGPCPGCNCLDQKKEPSEEAIPKVACDPPKCPSGCTIQTVFDGPCPGCECKKDKISCRRGEEYKECGTACPKSCSNLDNQFCIQMCVKGCFCPDGKVRGHNGRCIDPSKCSETKASRRKVLCIPPKCDPGCSIQTVYDGPCPGCDCEKDEELPELPEEKVVCDPPKCEPGCKIQTVYEGPCPECDCEKDEELFPGVQCDPPRCPPTCLIETPFGEPCPVCNCRSMEEDLPMAELRFPQRKVMCSPPKCDPGCRIQTVFNGPCPGCECKKTDELRFPQRRVMCSPPKCDPGCGIQTVYDGPCPGCECKKDDELRFPQRRVMCSPPKCDPGCRIQTVYDGPCPGCECKKDDEEPKIADDKVKCDPPKCEPGCYIQTDYEGPCPGCECGKDKGTSEEENFGKKVMCSPPKCPSTCTIQTEYSGPCPGCDCKLLASDVKKCPAVGECSGPKCSVENVDGCDICKCKPKCPRFCNRRCKFVKIDENGCAVCDCERSGAGN